jgi:hypothetical protein
MPEVSVARVITVKKAINAKLIPEIMRDMKMTFNFIRLLVVVCRLALKNHQFMA